LIARHLVGSQKIENRHFTLMSSDSSSSDVEAAEDANHYEKLELREHILKRPENYIGSIQRTAPDMQWVVEEGKFVQ
jgi:hypothetical protein